MGHPSKVPDDQVLKRQHLQGMKCIVHDLEVMGLNPGQVERGMQYFCPSYTLTENI